MADDCLSLVFSPRTRARPLGRAVRFNEHRGNVILIKKHDKNYMVELDDGSLWPGGLSFQILVMSFRSHALIDQTDGSRVRA